MTSLVIGISLSLIFRLFERSGARAPRGDVLDAAEPLGDPCGGLSQRHAAQGSQNGRRRIARLAVLVPDRTGYAPPVPIERLVGAHPASI